MPDYTREIKKFQNKERFGPDEARYFLMHFSNGEARPVTIMTSQLARIHSQYAKRPHRIFIYCPCERHIPAGRFAQHKKACEWHKGCNEIRKANSGENPNG